MIKKVKFRLYSYFIYYSVKKTVFAMLRPVTRAWASYHYQVFAVVYLRVLRTALILIMDYSIGYGYHGTASSVWTGDLHRTLGMEMAYWS
jgi:hypothetical protein